MRGSATSERRSAARLEDLARLRRARDRLDREFARPLRVSDLVRDAAMSSGHFARSFTRAYAESPYHYLLTRRVERAMALLRASVALTEVAAAVGYGSLGTVATLQRAGR